MYIIYSVHIVMKYYHAFCVHIVYGVLSCILCTYSLQCTKMYTMYILFMYIIMYTMYVYIVYGELSCIVCTYCLWCTIMYTMNTLLIVNYRDIMYISFMMQQHVYCVHIFYSVLPCTMVYIFFIVYQLVNCVNPQLTRFL